VSWDQCGAVCADADRDGICDGEDGECNADGQPSQCDRVPPACRRGSVPEVLNGCYTNRCVTWDECVACPDADRDGRCDGADPDCNSDGSLLMCRRRAPICPAGTVAEVRNGCYTEVCLDLAQCAEISGGPGLCGGFAGFPCPEGLSCVDNPADDCDPANGGADCGGVCANIACGPRAGRCPGGFACVDDPDDDCDPAAGAACAGLCVAGPAAPVACDPIRDGEFGACEALLGWGVNAQGACAPVSGCGCDDRCEGRVFPDERSCAAACLAR
jgi:hypothetical protein